MNECCNRELDRLAEKIRLEIHKVQFAGPGPYSAGTHGLLNFADGIRRALEIVENHGKND